MCLQSVFKYIYNILTHSSIRISNDNINFKEKCVCVSSCVFVHLICSLQWFLILLQIHTVWSILPKFGHNIFYVGWRNGNSTKRQVDRMSWHQSVGTSFPKTRFSSTDLEKVHLFNFELETIQKIGSYQKILLCF